MAEDNRLFKTEKEVAEYFIQLDSVRTNLPGNLHTERLFKKGIMIDTKLRRDILTGKNAGKITLSGIVEDYMFKSMSGGVYKCYVSDRRAANIKSNNIPPPTVQKPEPQYSTEGIPW